MSAYSTLDKYEKLLRKKARKDSTTADWDAQRKHFREIGPVGMVNELKLTVRGRLVELSEDQIGFLNDLAGLEIRFALVVAGRGSGKTLCLALYGLWRIICFDYFDISAMGGSAEQSDLIQSYISEWERTCPFVRQSLLRNVLGSGGRHAEVVSRNYTRMIFMACSATSTRGPHTQALFIDEVCVPSDTELITNNDFVPIVKCNEVFTHNQKIRKVEKLYERKYEGNILHIKSYYNNIGIKVTPNHPILVKRRGEVYKWKNRVFPEPVYRTLKRDSEWVKAGDLKKNDLLVFPVPQREVQAMDISDERLRLIGLWISEGSTGDHQIYWSNKDETIVKQIITDVQKEFNILPSVTTLKDGTKNIYITNHEFRKWLLTNCGHGCREKHIPKEFLSLPDKKIDVLIGAIMQGDGYENEEEKSLHVASRKLVQQFWFIYASRRLFSTISKLKTGYYCWSFWKSSGRRYGHIIDECMIVPIQDIKQEPYNDLVWNLKVENDNSYTVPYISLHNCAAEERGNIKSIKAAFGEVSTSENIQVILTSTAQFVFGFFKEILDDPEGHGFKVYRWSIAKHESGITDPYIIYKYKSGWKPNLPWVKQDALDFLRKNMSDDEWLVEALGGIASFSGLVLNPEDIQSAICSKCPDMLGIPCAPYQYPQCTLISEEKLKRVTERREGIDWGEVEPNAFTIVGRDKEDVYVLFNDELTGVRDIEALGVSKRLGDRFGVEIYLPDPAQYPMYYALIDAGLTVHRLFSFKGGAEKEMYVANAKRHFERKIIHIPVAFSKLCSSVKQLTYDKNGKIRKINDHSWDSLMYALAEYITDTSELYELPTRFVKLWSA